MSTKSKLEREQQDIEMAQRGLDAKKEQYALALTLTSKCSPAFDYAIERLKSSLSAMAANNGDKILSNYKVIPESIADTQGNYATISMVANSNWNFTIGLQGFNAAQGRTVGMTISSDLGGTNSISALVAFHDRDSVIETQVNYCGKSLLATNYALSSFETNIDELLTLVIGAQLESYPLKKVK
jgi:hypothetical protein